MNQQALFDYLSGIVGEKYVSIDEAILYLYSSDVAYDSDLLPDIVVRPKSKEEIVKIVRYAHDNDIPITPRGAGSGAAGGAVAINGGILLDLTRMNKILDLDVENFLVTVEPGVVLADLNTYLKQYDLFLPVDLGSADMANVGGTIANNGGGLRAVKYGVMRNYVMALEIVLPNGEVLSTGSKTRKNAVGFDLISLFGGSEGTLGVIIKAVLRVIAIPKYLGVVFAVYDDLYKAGKTVPAIFKSGVQPSAIEILDQSAILAINKYKPEIGLPTEAEAILLFEVDGSYPIDREISTISRICKERGAIDLKETTDDDERIRIWEARKLVGAAASRVREGYSRVYEGEDITVLPTQIPDILMELRELSKKYELPIVVFGHVGDGNLHPAITIEKDNPKHLQKLESLADEIHELALTKGGVVTGEHGIGVQRAKYLANNPIQLNVMREIKKALDPKNIMNPGKMDLDAIYER